MRQRRRNPRRPPALKFFHFLCPHIDKGKRWHFRPERSLGQHDFAIAPRADIGKRFQRRRSGRKDNRHFLYSDSGKAYPVSEADLPITLPEVTDFKPVTSDDKDADPVTPLGRVTDWLKVKGTILPDGSVKLGEGKDAKTFSRDTNTMPNWAGSCWYYMRYFSPNYAGGFVDEAAEKYWSGEHFGAKGSVDLYVGGTEHAVLHLLYARFWHKVFYDLGLVSTPEPFYKLFNQGMITADAYSDSRGFYVEVDKVEEREEGGVRTAYNKETGEKLTIR